MHASGKLAGCWGTVWLPIVSVNKIPAIFFITAFYKKWLKVMMVDIV